MLSLAKLKPGEAVLDVGAIALLARKHVGSDGRVEGIDASAEMIMRATAKARRNGLQVGFSIATAQELPFKDHEFDVVLSTLMLHHLPKKGRKAFSGKLSASSDRAVACSSSTSQDRRAKGAAFDSIGMATSI